jgi:hypothetical protein
MRVVDLSEFRDEEGQIDLENRIRATLQFGLGWYADIQAQEFVVERLGKVLDNEHIMLRNVPLVGTELVAPLILLSPQGVRLIHPVRKKGVFRAKEEEWQTFDGRLRRFRPTRPNLQSNVLLMARGIHRYLQAQGFPLPDLEAVLIFTNPQTHVDVANPAARIVLADAVDHFASKLLELKPIMDQEDIDLLVEAISHPSLPEPEPSAEAKAAAREVPMPAGFPAVDDQVFASEPLKPMETRREFEPVRRIGGLTMRQLALLAAMAFFELLIVGSLALMLVGDRFLARP